MHALQCDDIGAWNLRRPSNGTTGFGTPVVSMRTPHVLSRVSPGGLPAVFNSSAFDGPFLTDCDCFLDVLGAICP